MITVTDAAPTWVANYEPRIATETANISAAASARQNLLQEVGAVRPKITAAVAAINAELQSMQGKSNYGSFSIAAGSFIDDYTTSVALKCTSPVVEAAVVVRALPDNRVEFASPRMVAKTYDLGSLKNLGTAEAPMREVVVAVMAV